jgi:exonuclease VII large subunit
MRGGGAKSDLEWLNNYNIATTIKKSSIPIACGIGHETDNTILDLVCDYSCTTPSNLAHFVVDNSIKNLKTKLKKVLDNFGNNVDKFIVTSDYLETRLDSLTKDIFKTQLYQLERGLFNKATYLDNLVRYSFTKYNECEYKLEDCLKLSLENNFKKIEDWVNCINSLINSYNNSTHRIDNVIQNKMNNMSSFLSKNNIMIDKQEEKIKDLLSHLLKELEKFNPKIKINNKQIFTKKDFMNELKKTDPDNYKIVFVDGVLVMEF